MTSSRSKIIAIRQQAASNNNENNNNSNNNLIFDLYNSSTISYKHTLLVLLPYILSKVAIAANNAYLQYLFGALDTYSNNNDNNNTSLNSNHSSSASTSSKILNSEATIFQWEFLIMGLCMGGLRAVSVMAGKYCSKIYVQYLDLEVEYEIEKARRRARKAKIAAKMANGEPLSISEEDEHFEDENNEDDEDDDDDEQNSSSWTYSSSMLFRGYLRRRVFRVSTSDSYEDVENNKYNYKNNKHGKSNKKKRMNPRYSIGDIGLEIGYGTTTNNTNNNGGLSAENNNNNNNKQRNHHQVSSTEDLYRLDDEAEENLVIRHKMSHHIDLIRTPQNSSPNLSRRGSVRSSSAVKNPNRNNDAAAVSRNSSASHFDTRSNKSATTNNNNNNAAANKVTSYHIPSITEMRMFVKLRSVFVSSYLLTTMYGIVATVLFLFSKKIFIFLTIFDETSDAQMLDNLQDYSSGFAIGVLPTLWLYATEQFLLGCHASGTVLIYGTFYAAVSTIFVFVFSSPPSASIGSLISPYLFSTNPLFGIGLGMSVGAWISYIALHLHLTFIDREIFRDLCTIFAVFHALRERVNRPPDTDWRAAWETVKTTTKKYFGLSTAMGLSNLVGLVSAMIVAVVTTQNDGNANNNNNDQSKFYSIASAYYQTLAIAVLGASSAVSALVASTDGIAKHFRDKFLSASSVSQAEDDDENENENVIGDDHQTQGGVTHQKLFSTLSEEQSNMTGTLSMSELSSAKNQSPRLKTAIVRSLVVVFIFALLLAIPPLIVPNDFIEFFGGEISNYNSSSFLHVHNSDDNASSQIYNYLIPSFLSFVMMTLAMSVSASLHALFDVALPLLFHVVAYCLAGVWTVVLHNKYLDRIEDNDDDDDDTLLVVSTYGNVVGPVLYLIALVVLLVVRYLRK